MNLYSFFFFFGCTHSMRKFSLARDQTHATAVTRITTVTTLDPQPAESPGNSIFFYFFYDFIFYIKTHLP